MRASISLVSSTGESLRLRKSFPTSSMDAKARSVSFIGVILNHSRPCRRLKRHRQAWRLEDSFLMAEVPERANVGDDEGETKLILRAHLSEVDAAIFDSEAAAAAVVTELHDLVLQCLVLKVIAKTGSQIKPLAGFASVAEQPANLVGSRLLEGRHRGGRERKVAERRIVIQAEVGNGGK